MAPLAQICIGTPARVAAATRRSCLLSLMLGRFPEEKMPATLRLRNDNELRPSGTAMLLRSGAKPGASGRSNQATPSPVRRQSSQLDGLQGHIQHLTATVRSHLVSGRSVVRTRSPAPVQGHNLRLVAGAHVGPHAAADFRRG